MATEDIYEPGMMKSRIKTIVYDVLQKHIDDKSELDTESQYIADKVSRVINQHVKSSRILNNDERSYINKLEKRAVYLDELVRNRDSNKTEELKGRFGDRYTDFALLEQIATEWAVDFIKQYSL